MQPHQVLAGQVPGSSQPLSPSAVVGHSGGVDHPVAPDVHVDVAGELHAAHVQAVQRRAGHEAEPRVGGHGVGGLGVGGGRSRSGGLVMIGGRLTGWPFGDCCPCALYQRSHSGEENLS